MNDASLLAGRKELRRFGGAVIRRAVGEFVHDYSSLVHTGSALPITAEAGSGPK